jgi:hypothetical protein
MTRDPQSTMFQIVADDLDYLTNEWRDQMTDSAIRRGSVALRRLLNEGLLLQAWRAAGFAKKPRVDAPNLVRHIYGVRLNLVEFAVAGGAQYEGLSIAGCVELRYQVSADEMSRWTLAPPMESMELLAFRDAPSVIYRGYSILRREVIAYIANKLGGAHLDETRGTKPIDDAYRQLDALSEAKYELAGKDALHFEVLSAGQILASSSDLQELRVRIAT